jgi:hypothetical protein
MTQRACSAEAAAHLRRWLEDDRNFFTIAVRTSERADVSTAFALLTNVDVWAWRFHNIGSLNRTVCA